MSCLCHLVPKGMKCVNCYAAAGYPGAKDGTTGERNPQSLPRFIPAPKKSCGIKSCERMATTRGLCYLHYERQRLREKVSA